MSSLPSSTRQLIERLGATDQLAQQDQSIGLAAERAALRQQLAALSEYKTEQLYLLGEAAVLLENALLLADQPQTHLQLSAQLADLYLQFFKVTQEQRYLMVAGQILKPLSHSNHLSISWQLLRLHALGNQPALTQYWLKKLLGSGQVTWTQLDDLAELVPMRGLDWLQQLQQRYQH